MKQRYDAVVVGSGPNGLAAAITLARCGIESVIVERSERPGGGMRSSELTLPGFIHDECSAVHPLALCAPFFRSLDLGPYGLVWIDSPSCIAHLLDERTTVVLERSLPETAAQLGEDGDAWRRLFAPFVEPAAQLFPMLLAPLRIPKHPFLLARFGLRAIRSMCGLARSYFIGESAPALLAGISAHAMVPLEGIMSSSFGLVLGLAGHVSGWPIPRGGSQSIVDALVGYYRSLGGEIAVGNDVRHLNDLPKARAYLLDVSPRGLLQIAGDRLAASYERRLRRYRYGPGAFKVDWALRDPIPWSDPRCRRAVTVHLSGTIADIARATRDAFEGRMSERAPMIILTQPTIVDPTRTPRGGHTAWAYCHVPHGSSVDMLSAIESEIERFAPGFRASVLARATRNAVELERYDPNYVGGDINSGLSDARQLFFRPMARLDPYSTSAPDIFLCSSATPPGGGVHGMCGYWAARSALRKCFGIREERSSLERPSTSPRQLSPAG
jgi:phytoene dehydrogenase-like protein